MDDEPALAQRYKIMSIPAVFLFRDGEVVEKMIGARPKQSFADAIEENLYEKQMERSNILRWYAGGYF